MTKTPEAEIIHLIPKPSVDSWRTEEKNGEEVGVVAQVTVYHRLSKKKSKDAEKVIFTFFLDKKHLKRQSIKHRLELRGTVGTGNLSEKQIGELRRQAKDTLDAFHKEYKRDL